MALVAVVAIESYRHGAIAIGEHVPPEQLAGAVVASEHRAPTVGTTPTTADGPDADARALVATLLLDGARHGWQAH